MSKSKRLICWLCALLIFSLAACSPAVDQIPNNGTEPTPTATGSNQDEIGPTAQSTQPGAVPATAPGDSSAADALLNTQWRLVSIGAPGSETPLPVGADLTLEFQTEGLAAGSGGCNSFGADYAVQGDSLVFSQLISTMMACTDSNLMDLEQRYFKALQSSGKFEQSDEGLTIHYDQDAGSLNFIPLTDQPTPTPDATGLCSTTAVTSDPAWSLCSSLAYGFEFQFPTGGTLSDNTAASARIDLPFTPGTNLTEKYLQLDVQENASPCSSPLAAGYDPGTVPTEPATFNGLQFTKQGGHDAGAGNRYDLTAYSIDQGGTCLSLSFVLHSFVPELKPTPPPVYDPAAELAVFMEIMNTFVWPEAQTTPVPTASQPTQEPQRIEFAAGATSAAESGHLDASGSALYVLRALQGQTMTVELTFSQGQASLSVWGADGSVLMSDHSEASSFQGSLPASQDYYIQLKGRPDGPTDYQLIVTVPPLEPNTPTASPQTIHFASGTTSATVIGQLSASGSDLYRLYALAGQTMRLDLSASQGQAILVVWGEDGTVLQTNHTEVTHLERQLPASQYYFIQVEGYPDGPTDYSLQVTIPPV